MTDSQERAARIGAAVAYAETLRGQAEALQENAAQLLVGLEAHAQGLGAQEQRLAAQIAAFAKQVERLGPQAFAGGQAAVEKEVRAAVKGAPGAIVEAAREVTTPVRTTLAASLASIKAAEASLREAREQFSFRALAVIGTGALGGLALVCVGVVAALGWQRYEMARLVEQKADLQGEIASMEATAQKMRNEGLKIEFGSCGDNKGHTRLCVAVAPGAQRWGGEEKPFYVLKGY